MKNYSIGIDLGGTKILAGVVEKQTGKVIFEVKNKTKKEKGNKKITAKIIETLEELFRISNIDKNEISSVGIGLAGQVERNKGILINAVNLECKDLNIKTDLFFTSCSISSINTLLCTLFMNLENTYLVNCSSSIISPHVLESLESDFRVNIIK